MKNLTTFFFLFNFSYYINNDNIPTYFTLFIIMQVFSDINFYSCYANS